MVADAAVGAGMEVAGAARGQAVAAYLHVPEQRLAKADRGRLVLDEVAEIAGFRHPDRLPLEDRRPRVGAARPLGPDIAARETDERCEDHHRPALQPTRRGHRGVARRCRATSVGISQSHHPVMPPCACREAIRPAVRPGNPRDPVFHSFCARLWHLEPFAHGTTGRLPGPARICDARGDALVYPLRSHAPNACRRRDGSARQDGTGKLSVTDARTHELPARLTTEVCIVGAGAARPHAGPGARAGAPRGVHPRGRRPRARSRDAGALRSRQRRLPAAPRPYVPRALFRGQLQPLGGPQHDARRARFRAAPLGPGQRLADRPRRARAVLPQAGQSLGLPGMEQFDPARHAGRASADERQIFADANLTPAISLWAREPMRFGAASRRFLERAPGTRLVLNANVTGIRADEAGSRVQGVVASTLEGRQIEVDAQTVVLACGGLENARLLLASHAPGDWWAWQPPRPGRALLHGPSAGGVRAGAAASGGAPCAASEPAAAPWPGAVRHRGLGGRAAPARPPESLRDAGARALDLRAAELPVVRRHHEGAAAPRSRRPALAARSVPGRPRRPA